MATHSSILAWKIPWTEEAGGLYSPQGHRESDTTKQLKIGWKNKHTDSPNNTKCFNSESHTILRNSNIKY